jgi:signal transduction histidine kinase
MTEKRSKSFFSDAQIKFEQYAYRYHLAGCWVALVMNPLFTITDFYNFHQQWQSLLCLRLLLSLIMLGVVLTREKLNINSSVLVTVPFLLLILLNSYIYSFVLSDHMLGQNLGFMAMLIGAGMFILWRWVYSVLALATSLMASTGFICLNSAITFDVFFVHGGMLLMATGVFMMILIQTRYNLTRKTILAELALKASKKILQKQAKEIRSINENLEGLVRERTHELEKKNRVLEEYAFINSHKLRAPVASILGLLKLFSYEKFTPDGDELLKHLTITTKEMDKVVRDITRTIEGGIAD